MIDAHSIIARLEDTLRRARERIDFLEGENAELRKRMVDGEPRPDDRPLWGLTPARWRMFKALARVELATHAEMKRAAPTDSDGSVAVFVSRMRSELPPGLTIQGGFKRGYQLIVGKISDETATILRNIRTAK